VVQIVQSARERALLEFQAFFMPQLVVVLVVVVVVLVVVVVVVAA
jgi:hypothetical protein